MSKPISAVVINDLSVIWKPDIVSQEQNFESSFRLVDNSEHCMSHQIIVIYLFF